MTENIVNNPHNHKWIRQLKLPHCAGLYGSRRFYNRPWVQNNTGNAPRINSFSLTDKKLLFVRVTCGVFASHLSGGGRRSLSRPNHIRLRAARPTMPNHPSTNCGQHCNRDSPEIAKLISFLFRLERPTLCGSRSVSPLPAPPSVSSEAKKIDRLWRALEGRRVHERPGWPQRASEGPEGPGGPWMAPRS